MFSPVLRYQIVVAASMLALLVAPAALFFPPPPQPTALISNAAELILRTRLRAHRLVSVSVDGSPADLLSGRVAGVQVAGSGWCTPMKLSCEELRFNVGRTSLDFSKIPQGRIVLQQPARGSAKISFTAEDWGNFLAHPLLLNALTARRRSAAAPSVTLGRAAIDASGAVRFNVVWGGVALVASLSQPVGSSRAKVACAAPPPAEQGSTQPPAELPPELEEAARDAAAFLEGFFNELLVDLDGCELRFRSLEVAGRAASPRSRAVGAALLELDLDVCVKRFPSPAINF